MLDFWSAIVGALLGGAVSALAVIWQTQRTLRHDLDQAREERQAREQADRHAAIVQAAGALLDALSDYASVPNRHRDPARWFGGSASEREHHERTRRIRELQRAGYIHLHLMPEKISTRWRRLVWLAQIAAGNHEGTEDRRQRDAHDAWSYTRYVRESITALITNKKIPADVPYPDPLRDEKRLWGWQPPAEAREPDYTEWIKTRFGASTMVTLNDGSKQLPPPEM